MRNYAKVDTEKLRAIIRGTPQKPVVNEIFDKESMAWFDYNVKRSKINKFGSVEVITPAKAKILLSKNIKNRRLNTAMLGKIAEDITSNRYTENGESIIISKTGKLEDGQTRLHAVIKANKPISTFISWGVEEGAGKTTDKGKQKTVSNSLEMSSDPIFEKVKNHKCLSTVATLDLANRVYGRYHIQGNKYSHSEIIEHAKKIVSEYNEAHDLCHGATSLVTYPEMVYAAMLLTRAVGKNDTKIFVRSLIDMAGPIWGKDKPVWVVRRYIVNAKKKFKYKNCEIVNMILRGWNLVASSKKDTKLLEPTEDGYPTIIKPRRNIFI